MGRGPALSGRRWRRWTGALTQTSGSLVWSPESWSCRADRARGATSLVDITSPPFPLPLPHSLFLTPHHITVEVPRWSHIKPIYLSHSSETARYVNLKRGYSENIKRKQARGEASHRARVWVQKCPQLGLPTPHNSHHLWLKPWTTCFKPPG